MAQAKRAGLLSVPLPPPSAPPAVPGAVGLLPTAHTQDRTNPMQDGIYNPNGFEVAPRPGNEISTQYDRDTGAPMDPMAYEGSLLGHDAQATLQRQAGEAGGGRDFAGEKLADLRGVGPISQYGAGGSEYDAITAGAMDRNKEHFADLERKIYRDAPLYQAKSQARAAKNFIQSENIRFRNWTLRQQQKIQKLALEQALEGEKDALIGTVLGAGGAAIGTVIGGPAGTAIGGAAGSAAGKAL